MRILGLNILTDKDLEVRLYKMFKERFEQNTVFVEGADGYIIDELKFDCGKTVVYTKPIKYFTTTKRGKATKEAVVSRKYKK